jgi:hypothetical protein
LVKKLNSLSGKKGAFSPFTAITMFLPPLPKKGTASFWGMAVAVPPTSECLYKSAIICEGKEMLFRLMKVDFKEFGSIPFVSLHR